MKTLIQLVRDSFIRCWWGQLVIECRGLVTFAVVIVIALVLLLKVL